MTASTSTPSDAVRGSERSVKLVDGDYAWIQLESVLPAGNFKLTAFSFTVNNVARAVITIRSKTIVIDSITVRVMTGVGALDNDSKKSRCKNINIFLGYSVCIDKKTTEDYPVYHRVTEYHACATVIIDNINSTISQYI